MSHITIDIHSDAEKYCTTFSGIGDVLGTITWDGEPGALVRTQAGVYLYVTIGAIYRLPQQVIAKNLQELEKKSNGLV